MFAQVSMGTVDGMFLEAGFGLGKSLVREKASVTTLKAKETRFGK